MVHRHMPAEKLCCKHKVFAAKAYRYLRTTGRSEVAREIAHARVLAPPQNCAILWLAVGEIGMARKRHSEEDILKLLREIELHLAGVADVATACRAAGVSDAT